MIDTPETPPSSPALARALLPSFPWLLHWNPSWALSLYTSNPPRPGCLLHLPFLKAASLKPAADLPLHRPQSPIHPPLPPHYHPSKAQNALNPSTLEDFPCKIQGFTLSNQKGCFDGRGVHNFHSPLTALGDAQQAGRGSPQVLPTAGPLNAPPPSAEQRRRPRGAGSAHAPRGDGPRPSQQTASGLSC